MSLNSETLSLFSAYCQCHGEVDYRSQRDALDTNLCYKVYVICLSVISCWSVVSSGTPAIIPIDHYHDIAILLNGILNIHSLSQLSFNYDSMDLFHIPDLFLTKFKVFLYELSPLRREYGTRSGESNGNGNTFEYILLS